MAWKSLTVSFELRFHSEVCTMTDVNNIRLPHKHNLVDDDEVLLYVHRNRRVIRDGEPRTATSSFTQLLNSVLQMLLYVHRNHKAY